MRFVSPITVLALAGAGALLVSWGDLGNVSERLDEMPFSRGATEAEVALEVRCGDLEDELMRHSCEDELSERFASGNAQPETVLRMYCTRARTVWEQNLPEPPPLCAARFGGWLSG